MKILFAVITAGRIEAGFMSSFVDALMTYTRVHPEGEVYFRVFDGSMTHIARNQALEMAIEAEIDTIVMVDDDMLLKSDTFANLVTHDVPMVAAAAYKKRPPYELCAWHYVEGRYYPLEGEMQPLELVHAVGFGCVAIQIKELRKVKAPYCVPTAVGGEDIMLCRKFNDAGLGVYLDTANSIGHIGRMAVVDGQVVVQ